MLIKKGGAKYTVCDSENSNWKRRKFILLSAPYYYL